MKVVVLVALVGCSYAPLRADSTADDAPPSTTDDAANDGPKVLGPWSVPVPIAELNSAFIDDDPSLTDDLLEIYFGSNRDTLDEEIFVAKRATVTEPFGAPQRVPELNSGSIDTTPRVSRDGLTMMFASTRQFVDLEIYISTRPSRSANWTTPARVTELDSQQSDFGAVINNERTGLIFASGRTGGMGEDFYTSQRANAEAAWGAPVRFAEISGASSDVDPMPIDEDTIYFASDRDRLDVDIFLATRVGGQFVVAPVTELNSAAIDRDIWVSSDQRTAVFSSTRNSVNDDLFISTRSFQ